MYTTPGVKDQKYLGKEIGESRYAEKRHLLWTLEEMHFILNGGALVETGKSFYVKFSKEVIFRQPSPRVIF